MYEPVIGRYLRLPLDDVEHRVYIEEAGTGTPLLCLHTAGADTRQWRHVMNDPAITSRFRVIAFDLPYHGKSSPPAGYQNDDYRLTADRYMATVMGVIDALALERPIVTGCSIGGRVVLHLALHHADRLGGLIGLETGAHVDPYYDLDWLDRPDVHGGMVCAAIVSGLIAPDCPDADRHETLWHYLQSGPGVFKGDLFFYVDDGDIRGRLHDIDTSVCPMVLLTGEFDYSCTPSDTLAVAEAVPDVSATIMRGLGHFPMSEDYPRFRPYFLEALDQVVTRSAGNR
ncbi:MAG: alpha/beta fold hydrolase [Acidimicrobiia bacterium]